MSSTTPVTPVGIRIRAAASSHALHVGALWLVSFGCTMHGLDHPVLGLLGNLLGLASIVVLGRTVRAFRASEAHLGWLGSLRLAMHTCFLASLVTTLGQYLYFAFLDDGHFLSTISTLLTDPLYASAALRGVDTSELLRALSQMTTRDIILQFLFVNFLLSIPCGLLGSLIGSAGKVEPRTDGKPNP